MKDEIKGSSKKVISWLIGSNNKTHEVEYNKIEAEFNKMFEGYGLIKNEGHYKGNKEASCIVEVICFKEYALNDILNFTQNLKRVLKQEAIYLKMGFINLIEV